MIENLYVIFFKLSHTYMPFPLNAIASDQVRAARALLGWSQHDLATRAEVAVSTIADFERDARSPIANNVSAIRHALERAGVVFIEGGVQRGVHWTFITESSMGSLLATFDPNNPGPLRELAAVFGTPVGDKVQITPVQCATPELKAKVEAFVDVYGPAAKHLFRIRKLITDLRDGEFFLIMPEAPSSTADTVEAERLLHQLNHPGENSFEKEREETFGPLLERYDMLVAQTGTQTNLGPARKENSVCRFCHRSVKNGATFKKKAHAISAAVGNRLLKSNDECDQCNEFFGEELETTLVEMMNIQRVFLGIQGRSGRPEIRSSTGRMFNDGNKMLVFSNSITEEAGGVLTTQLGAGKPIVLQHFYRMLAKFALALMPEEHLASLKRTVDWVRTGAGEDLALPKIATAVIALPPNPSAQVTIYIRRDEGSTLPHVVGEFRLGCFVYVFALPFSDCDDWNLVEFFDDPVFKETFRHYQHFSWKLQDFSDTKKKNLSQNIRIEPRKPTADAAAS